MVTVLSTAEREIRTGFDEAPNEFSFDPFKYKFNPIVCWNRISIVWLKSYNRLSPGGRTFSMDINVSILDRYHTNSAVASLRPNGESASNT